MQKRLYMLGFDDFMGRLGAVHSDSGGRKRQQSCVCVCVCLALSECLQCTGAGRKRVREKHAHRMPYLTHVLPRSLCDCNNAMHLNLPAEINLESAFIAQDIVNKGYV